MKYLFSIFVFVPSFLFAQSGFNNQMDSIISSSVGRFVSVSGPFKRFSSDSRDTILFSNIALQDTWDNEVVHSQRAGVYYSASIGKTNNKKKAIKICDEWQRKLQTALPAFSSKEYTIVDYNPSIHGWFLSGSNTGISLMVVPLFNQERKPEFLVYMHVYALSDF